MTEMKVQVYTQVRQRWSGESGAGRWRQRECEHDRDPAEDTETPKTPGAAETENVGCPRPTSAAPPPADGATGNAAESGEKQNQPAEILIVEDDAAEPTAEAANEGAPAEPAVEPAAEPAAEPAPEPAAVPADPAAPADGQPAAPAAEAKPEEANAPSAEAPAAP